MSTAERKTLSIKSSSSAALFGSPSKIALIEQALKEASKSILQEYADIPTSTYDDQYRTNVVVVRKLGTCIGKALEDLKEAIKYPSQTTQVFEKMGKNVHAALMDEVGIDAIKFNEAFE